MESPAQTLLHGNAGYQHQLFTESVMDEVLLSMDNEDETVADEILKQFDLLEYKDRHPLSLSGGQKTAG